MFIHIIDCVLGHSHNLKVMCKHICSQMCLLKAIDHSSKITKKSNGVIDSDL